MQIYAVLLPSGQSPPVAAEKARLLRQGFSWPAFLYTPFWALRHGLFLALSLWIVWVVAASSLISLAHLDLDAGIAVYGLGALLFGLEADKFRQSKLARGGFLLNGLAIGENAKDAEGYYFSHRNDLNSFGDSPVAARAAEGGALARPESENDLLGLFSAGEPGH